MILLKCLFLPLHLQARVATGLLGCSEVHIVVKLVGQKLQHSHSSVRQLEERAVCTVLYTRSCCALLYRGESVAAFLSPREHRQVLRQRP